ncbi:MAG TPA: 3-deoxy-D-manno-octulosonic acid transferase [Tepidisphaeraceae bacterium]
MINAYDITWGTGLALTAPFWLLRGTTRRKVFKALNERMARDVGTASPTPAVLIHAVSLGEMNATRAMVSALAQARPDLRFIITVTTETGNARGLQLYGNDPRVTLLRYPLDFSSAISRLLDQTHPSVVVLMELEVWPNFTLHCQKRGIPVLLVNGRLTPGSFRNYRLGGPLVRRMFRRLTAICAQEPDYAQRFIQLGAPPDRVRVTGTMKFDTAQLADQIEGADEIAHSVGLSPTNEIWICGSTGPGEETILIKTYRDLLPTHPSLRLVIVPRKPERFDEVATEIQAQGFPLVRRSTQISNPKSEIPNLKSEISNSKSKSPPIILGDTMGELRKFYSLAQVVFVGRSLVDLGSRQHGSDMIEPAALAKPIAIGPFTGNFAEVMNRFRLANAIREVSTPDELRDQIDDFLKNRDSARQMGLRAQEVVRQERGATARHVDLILKYIPVATHTPANPAR